MELLCRSQDTWKFYQKLYATALSHVPKCALYPSRNEELNITAAYQSRLSYQDNVLVGHAGIENNLFWSVLILAR